jgi:diacylglycerol O-acyltransferase / wax synthase
MPSKQKPETSNRKDGERLSWGDALFLYLERAGMPLNIASVSIFEGDISLDECRRFIDSKLPLLQRYRQRALAPPFNAGFPSWEDDLHFDIRNHIKEVHLKDGTEAELKSVSGRVLSTVMDREHPLWDITLVHGLEGDRMGMVIRVHHCLADGIAGVSLVNVLLDPSPVVRRIARKQTYVTKRQRDSLTLLLEGCISTYSDLLQRAFLTQAGLMDIMERTLGLGLPTDALAKFLPELSAPTQRLFFNKIYQGPQEFAWAQIPTEAIKAIRKRCEGTHNDVVLALVTATIRKYAERHGDDVKGRLFRMTVPVNVRGGNDATELGNRILFLPVTVPLDIRGPQELLAACHERTDFLKRAHVAEWVGVGATLLSVVPPPLQALVGPLASMLPISLCNMVCTNIRGPDEPLYLLGHKMTDWYPYVPVGGEMTLNCAILSYRGITYFGFSGDAQAATDMHELEALLQQSAAELLRASGVRPPKAKKTSRRTSKAPSPGRQTPPPASATSSTEAAVKAPRNNEPAPLSTAAD